MNSRPNYWLAIETSSPCVSLALGDGPQCLRSVSREGNASECIEPLFRELEIDPDQVQRYVVGQGPGSYNGLRVGYGFLKGILCLDPRPVIQVPTPLTLAALAFETSGLDEACYLVLNNARRNELYGALIEIRQNFPKLQWEWVGSEEKILSRLPAEISAVVSYDYTSTHLPRFGDYPWIRLIPTAEATGRLAERLQLPATISLFELEPHYVRSAATAPTSHPIPS